MPRDPRSKQQETVAKIILSVLFMGVLGLLAYWVEVKAGWLKILELTAMDVILIGVSTFRLGRMIAFDRIMDPLREPFSKVVDDNSGEGKTVVPRGNGFRQALGQLIVCPTCVGTWVAAVLVALMLVYPAGTRIFLYATAAVGLAEILHSLTEVLCWTARNARTSSGYVMEKKKAVKVQNESLNSHSQDD